MCTEGLVRLACLSLVAAAGCANHELDLSLALATDSCTTPVPAGGSLLYQITGEAGDASTTTSMCGGCLAVPATLADANAILGFLRTNAPTCPGVKPSSSLRVNITGYSAPGCADPTTRVFCSQSPTVTLPDGHADAVVQVTLTCDPTCTGRPCMPSTCLALGKNCGPVPDGCGGTLQCGACSPPNQCGGHAGGGVPGVCSK
jgi:hypothetical protein